MALVSFGKVESQFFLSNLNLKIFETRSAHLYTTPDCHELTTLPALHFVRNEKGHAVESNQILAEECPVQVVATGFAKVQI